MDDTEPCELCGRTRHTTWAHAFTAWLCHQCRAFRTEKELHPERYRLPPDRPETVTGAHP